MFIQTLDHAFQRAVDKVLLGNLIDVARTNMIQHLIENLILRSGIQIFFEHVVIHGYAERDAGNHADYNPKKCDGSELHIVSVTGW